MINNKQKQKKLTDNILRTLSLILKFNIDRYWNEIRANVLCNVETSNEMKVNFNEKKNRAKQTIFGSICCCLMSHR